MITPQLLQVLADVASEDEGETPVVAVVIVLLVAFAVVGLVLTRMRRRTRQTLEGD